MDLTSIQQYVFRLFESILNGMLSSGRISLPESSNITVHFQNSVLPAMVKQIAETHFRFNPYTNTYEPIRQIDQNLLSQAIMQEIDKVVMNMRMSGPMNTGNVFSRPMFQQPVSPPFQTGSTIMGNSHISSIYGGGGAPQQPATMFPTPAAPVQTNYEIKSTPQTQYEVNNRVNLSDLKNGSSPDTDITVSTILSRLEHESASRISDHPVRAIDFDDTKLDYSDFYGPNSNIVILKKADILNEIHDVAYLHLEIKDISFNNEYDAVRVANQMADTYILNGIPQNVPYFLTVKAYIHSTPFQITEKKEDDVFTAYKFIANELVTQEGRKDYKKLPIDKILSSVDKLSYGDIPLFRELSSMFLLDINSLNKVIFHHKHFRTGTYCLPQKFKKCFEIVECLKDPDYEHMFRNTIFLNRVFRETSKLIYRLFPEREPVLLHTEGGIEYYKNFVEPYRLHKGRFLINCPEEDIDEIKDKMGKTAIVFAERDFHITNIHPSQEVLKRFSDRKRYLASEPQTVLEHILDKHNNNLLPVFYASKNGYLKFIAGRNFEGEFTMTLI